MFGRKSTEGSGLGSPDQPWESDLNHVAILGAQNLDRIAAKFPVGQDLTVDEAKKLIQRTIRCKAEDHAIIDAVFTGLLTLGALESVEWRLGPRVVRRAENLSTPRIRRKATRESYELCLNEVGNYQSVLRSDAPAFRRRVLLFNLDMDEREAVRLAEQRRLLREQVALDAAS